jgi:hypothetical protein
MVPRPVCKSNRSGAHSRDFIRIRCSSRNRPKRASRPKNDTEKLKREIQLVGLIETGQWKNCGGRKRMFGVLPAEKPFCFASEIG